MAVRTRKRNEMPQNKLYHNLKKLVYIGITAYMLVILGILPLYHRNGFYMIGDMKYRFFLYASVIFLPVMLVLLLIMVMIQHQKWKLSPVDICALGYAIVICLSYAVSEYKGIALAGYMDWHMGLVTQLLFVAIYAAVSRGWKWDERVVWYMCGIAGFIFLLGLLNRYAIDPLGMYGGLEYWNKTHLLATIGNINWYCGYFCVVFPIGFYYYWNGREKRFFGIIWLLFVIVAFGTIVTQGSESGLVAFAIIMFLYFLLSFESNRKMLRFLEANVVFGITCLLLKVFYYLLQERAYFGVDLPAIKIITSSVWVYYTIAVIVVYAVFRYAVKVKNIQIEKHKRIRSICVIVSVLAANLLIAAMLIHVKNKEIFPVIDKLSFLNLNDMWGSGRGLLWPLTWKAFYEMPFVNQLFGVGPDCFAPYMYTYYGSSLQGFLQGWWGDAVVANAHNEWLNTLINTGVLGLSTYMGIMVTGVVGFLKKQQELPILLAFGMSIIMYMINNTASFQQVVSTPILFMVIGMGENIRRNNLLK